MQKYILNAKNQDKEIFDVSPHFKGVSPEGETIEFTNYYMKKNGKPFIGITGEFHFSRYDWKKWEDELIKIKMGGINILPTYIFWNHHEEIRGQFDWKGSKNLRLFVELCQKVGLYVIIRVGPFDHGEVRNGGFPDWLYGMPCELRSNDPLYLKLTKRLYQEIGYQVKGLMYKDGGPIIGIQLENEFCHSAAPWEMTTGTSNEWVDGGRDGEEHMQTLHELAIDSGLDAPFYTATAWGGAIAPTDTVMPLWGGYAFWPWIFYDKEVTEHPVTPEYIYRDYHNNDKPETYNFDPDYKPEECMYACCEMAGGMTVFYDYRFEMEYESIAALANIKLAGGCNFVGYYMYHGGTNPKGKATPFLNENSTPKLSYDYQAAIGEFGQLRKSYHELKKLHYFLHAEEQDFALLKTILPDGAEEIEPTDPDSLRYAFRVKDDSGYLFINNYQDHMDLSEKNDVQINLELQDETLLVPSSQGMDIAVGESLILPINYSMKDSKLKYATAQLITHFEEDVTTFVFYKTKKMNAEFSFEKGTVSNFSDNVAITENDSVVSIQLEDNWADFNDSNGNAIRIYLLENEESDNIWEFEYQGQKNVWISNGAPIVKEDGIRFEVTDKELYVRPITANNLEFMNENLISVTDGLYPEYVFNTTIEEEYTLEIEEVTHRSALVKVPHELLENAKETLLCVDYSGDVSYAFIDGEMINDNFNNGATWEFGLSTHKDKLLYESVYIKVAPNKENREVKSDSPMAARKETELEGKQLIDNVTFRTINEVKIY